ncbi:MAG: DUF1385 domain-containing protein [Candidatus Eisenbacteria bacterium]|nr:DUF1385 domain-containing protein [Candidatus Eisenbacteria bacterium]
MTRPGDSGPKKEARQTHATPEARGESYDSPISGFGEQPSPGGKVHYGGQAVIEGVMMRGPTKVATAVRLPSGGIAVHAEPFVSFSRKNRLLRLPVVRGGLTLIESLQLGLKSLNYSAGVAMEAAEDEAREGDVAETGETAGAGADDHQRGAANDPEPGQWKTTAALTGTMVFALALGVLFFFYIPLVLTDFIMVRTGLEGSVLFNLIDGVIRVAFFLAYIWSISLWKEMRRVFEYHGAEHKTIFMEEAGDELTPENAKKYVTKHPRCGTSFLLIVMVVSILVFMLTGRPQTIVHRLARLLLIPVIAGISYEIMKLSAKRAGTWWARLLSAPGVWLQNITTKEPSDDQVEVAIAALEAARVEEPDA